MAGTSKIRSFCVTTTASEDETSEGHPENSKRDIDASIAFGQRKAGQRIDRIQEQTSVAEATFWRMCLLRTINIFMALAMMSLTLRGNREHVGDVDCQGGNFPALVAMHAWFDPVLQQDLLQTHPSRERERERVYCPIVRYQLIKTVSAVNEITQPAISFTLFGTLVILGIPLYDLLLARQGPQMIYCLWAPECVETPLLLCSMHIHVIC